MTYDFTKCQVLGLECGGRFILGTVLRLQVLRDKRRWTRLEAQMGS